MNTLRPTDERDMKLFGEPILRIVARQRFLDDDADLVSCWEFDGNLDAALAWCAHLSERVLEGPHLVELFACTSDDSQPPRRGVPSPLICLLLRSWRDGSGIPVNSAGGFGEQVPGSEASIGASIIGPWTDPPTS